MHIEFPESLPINQRRDEIAELIRDHQVVIVAGETGSGKTTQLPKICLSLGLGENGLIGHTQPRRIAARTVADRIASELKVGLGNEVGYQVRFNDQSNDKTRLKLMTDGVLLAEIQHDRLLKKYDVIIIDEAHERSLNIDFLLGLLKPICRKRPELKVIITSATIDLERFANHFASGDVPAPIIEVSGRTYPVQTVYREPQENEALADCITRTIKHIARTEAKGEYNASGDILVFCAGEREIRDAAQAIRKAQLPVEVLPLYSRLSVQEQNKVFKPAHRRKIVLATNVAETSITVPGIAYVIDPGLARISRYSFRSKIQRLPIEAISQASANQRQGRCGRVANGVCIRLYSQEDFEQRAEFTPAEILRSNLASVILRMMRLGIKDINEFDFVDHPDTRLLNDGRKLLTELQAIEIRSSKKTHTKDKANFEVLTKIGRSMSDLPIDPRFARILFAANEIGCLRDALVLISVLSIQDPRERPGDQQQKADERHKELHHPQSDFTGFLHLWQSINDLRSELSNTKFKEACLKNYWSIARIFEWREMVRQLGQMCKDQGWKIEPWAAIKLPESSNNNSSIQKTKQNGIQNQSARNTGVDERYAKLHQALLSGMLGNIATKDIEGNYLATRSRKVHLFPASAIAKQKPKWIVASEYLETSRVFALNAAEISPAWVIASAAHLVKYSYSSPHYHIKSGTIKALRKTLLQGLVLKDKELVGYAQINREETRQLFIQEALVATKYKPRGNKAEFVKHNAKLIKEIEVLESKTRRRNLLVDDGQLFNFFERRIPGDICSRAGLEKWLAKGNDEKLKFTREFLLAVDLDSDQIAQFPNSIKIQGKEIKVTYAFLPGQETDGVTMHIPISVLAPFPEHFGDWLVPGILREKCIALIKTLPKTIRRHYAPASDAIDRVFDKLKLADKNLPLTEVLADILFRTRGTKITKEDFDLSRLDAYYRVNYLVIDVDGSLIEQGSNLPELKLAYADKVKSSVHAKDSKHRQAFEQKNLKEWDFGDLREFVEYQHQGMTVRAHPALVVNADKCVDLKVVDNKMLADYHNHFGIVYLAQKVLSNTTHKQAYKYLQKEILKPKKSMGNNAGANKGLGQLATQLQNLAPKLQPNERWASEIIESALSHVCFDSKPNLIRQQYDFDTALTGAKTWVSYASELENSLLSALKARATVFHSMESNPAQTIEIDTAYEDIKAQLYSLFSENFLRYTSMATLKQYPRFIKAIQSRLERVQYFSGAAEQVGLIEIQNRFDAYCDSLTPDGFNRDFALILEPKLNHFRILLEEWRVSIYAQHLRTQQPVSEKRLNKYWHEHFV